MDHGPIHDSLRLTQSELDAVLAELNRTANISAAAAKRTSKRWNLQSQKALLTLVDLNGNKTHHQVTPRNISKSGCAVLFGGFLHPGAKCFLSMRAVSGAAKVLPGKVVHCQHVKGRLHQLGISFSQPANPRDFFIQAGEEYLFNCERVSLPELRGNVLVVDDSVAVQRLISHYLAGSAIEVSTEENGADAIEAFKNDPDLALIDYLLPDTNGIELVSKLRQLGYRQPIVLMSAEQDKELRMAGIAAGASELLFKPISPELLHRAMAEYLGEEARKADSMMKGGGAKAVAAGVSPAEMNVYAATLRKTAPELKKAVEAGDSVTIRAKLLDMQGTASAFGFDYFTERARDVLKMLEGTNGLERAAGELRALVRACEKAQGPQSAEDAE